MKRIVRYKCTYPECNYWTFSEYNNGREVAHGAKHRDNYKCTRHTDPDSVLSPTCTKRSIEMENQKHPRAEGNFWDGSYGFQYGPGFKAWADDFPIGTKLKITAEIILPKN